MACDPAQGESVPGIAERVFVSTPSVWLLTLGVGIVTGFLPYVLYSFGLQRMESSRASILASLEPVVGTLFGIFLFDEPLTLGGGIGTVLVLSAVAILALPEKRIKTDPTE